MVDVPRFELGASSMPRKRASRLRHTPSRLATYDAHLRRVGYAAVWPTQTAALGLRCLRRFLKACWINLEKISMKKMLHSFVTWASI